MYLYDKKEKAARIWRGFDRVSGSKKKRAHREALLAHTFDFSGGGLDHDDGNVVVKLDGQSTKITAAERGVSYFEFYSFVKGLQDGNDALFSWGRRDDETIRQRLLWFFSRRGEVLYIEIPDFSEGVLIRYGDFLAQVAAKGVTIPNQETREEKGARLWRKYEKLGPKKREEVLRHTFAWSPGRMGRCGWQDLSVSLDGKTAYYHVSDVGCHSGDAGDDLIRWVKSLPPHADGYFSWSREPGSYDWYFSRREDILYMEVPEIRDGVFMRYGDFLRALTEEEGEVTE